MGSALATQVVFGAYSASGFVAAIVVFAKADELVQLAAKHDSPALLQTLAYSALASLILLGFGTGCDNARMVAGTLSQNFGDGEQERAKSSRCLPA